MDSNMQHSLEDEDQSSIADFAYGLFFLLYFTFKKIVFFL